MLPSISGIISVHDLKTVFSGSTDWITIHQVPESTHEEEFMGSGPFIEISFQIIPGEPVQTEIVTDPTTGMVKRIKLRRKGQDILVKA